MTALHLSPQLITPLVFFLVLLVGLALVGKVPISYNIRNLLVRWRITLLTALAFTLVVGLMTVMLAFVNGMYRLLEGSAIAANVIVLSDGATDELFSNLGYSDISNIDRQPEVAKDVDGQKMSSWETYIVVNQPIVGAEKSGRKRRFLQVRGIKEPERSGRVHNLALHDGGQWFSPVGVEDLGTRSNSKIAGIQAVLGEGIARELGKDMGKKTLEVGDLFEIADSKWIVKGIMKSAGSTFDSEIWAKDSRIQPMFGKQGYSTVVLRTPDEESARTLAKELTARFKESAVQCQLETEYYEKLNTTNEQFLVAILFVAGIIAIGGIFGIMNTMFAAISQRIKDIGVLRIIGFARWQILTSFFLESLFLALIGGIVGVTIGSLANGHTATSIISSGAGGGGKSVVLKLIVDANILLGGILFSLAMGCLGGLLPALSAMRLKPLDAVR
jgi:putative ABC transport system permease protein